ncbi:transposase [Dietzia sp.]|uniref:transposase n=1 Tax=Dietzia sp. TaxID=1871616 RepID=UPI003FA5700E
MRASVVAPFGNDRRIFEAILYRYRVGIRWRDLPRDRFGPWQPVWKRHRRYARDGTWDRVLAQILAEADAAGRVDWNVCRRDDHSCSSARDEHDQA